MADLHDVPMGAYNVRANGGLAGRNNTANIDIVSKEDGSGIDIHIKLGTRRESVHIPVVLSQSGLKETVYNDFFVGEGSDVTIVAGCGIDNCGVQDSEHDGVHRFYVGKNTKVKYIRQCTTQFPEALRPMHELAHDERRPWSVEQQQEPRHPALGKIHIIHSIENLPH